MSKPIAFGVVSCLVGTVCVALSASMLNWLYIFYPPWILGWLVIDAYLLVVGTVGIIVGIQHFMEA